MKRFNMILASVALSLWALLPAAAHADDDELDVTMEVLDSIADIDGDVIVMEGPEHDDFDDHEDESDERERDGVADHDESDRESDRVSDDMFDEEHESERDFLADASDDGFTHDDDFESDEDEEHAEEESDFDEGDDIDTDEHDEEPMDGDSDLQDDIAGDDSA